MGYGPYGSILKGKNSEALYNYEVVNALLVALMCFSHVLWEMAISLISRYIYNHGLIFPSFPY